MRLHVAGTAGIGVCPPGTADAARAIDRLEEDQREKLMTIVEPEQAADLLEQIPYAQVVDIVDGLEPDKAADIIEELPSDTQADVLGDLEPQEAEDILNEMERIGNDSLNVVHALNHVV